MAGKNPKFIVLFQPVYSPWVNQIERLWHALHETITRNHQCRTLGELLRRVFTSWIMPPRSPVMDMGLCNWSEIRISYLGWGDNKLCVNVI